MISSIQHPNHHPLAIAFVQPNMWQWISPPFFQTCMKSLLPKRFLYCLLLSICLAGAPHGAFASWFGRDSSKPTEKAVAVLSPWRVEKFKKAVAYRTQRSEEIIVLQRLVDEKKEELASLNKTLIAEYEIDPSLNYAYDAATLTIQKVEAAAGSETPIKIPHRKLADEDAGKAFVRIVVARQLTIQQIDTFQTVLGEKQLEYRRAEDVLKTTFGIQPDRNYRFDEEKRTIFEVVPPPKSDSESKKKAKDSPEK